MSMEFDLIPQGTLLRENGHGEAVDIRSSATRTFYCTMVVHEQIEQESVDVSIWGSADGGPSRLFPSGPGIGGALGPSCVLTPTTDTAISVSTNL